MSKGPITATKIWLGFLATVVVIGVLWFALAPTPPEPMAPSKVQVKVEKPPEVPELAGVGAEKSQPQATVEEVIPPAPKVQEPAPGNASGNAPGPHPKIAIIIDDVGLDLKGSQRAIDLPSAITLSFLPYASHIKSLTRDAHEQGHELLLHMPMEPLGHDNPGPGALLVGLPTAELKARFQAALSSFVGFDGVNNHMGSKFTADPKGMEVVMDELQQRHLFFLDSRTTTKTVGESMAKSRGLPTIGRDIFLDDEENAEAIKKQLDLTERVANRRGYAVAIGHPHAVTMDVLEEWVKKVQQQGYTLVPLHNLIAMKSPSAAPSAAPSE